MNQVVETAANLAEVLSPLDSPKDPDSGWLNVRFLRGAFRPGTIHLVAPGGELDALTMLGYGYAPAAYADAGAESPAVQRLQVENVSTIVFQRGQLLIQADAGTGVV